MPAKTNLFKEHLDEWRAQFSSITVNYTVDKGEPAQEGGHVGFINKKAITQYMPDITERKIFLFGGQSMVKAMKKCCLDMKCKEEQICTEYFIVI